MVAHTLAAERLGLPLHRAAGQRPRPAAPRQGQASDPPPANLVPTLVDPRRSTQRKLIPDGIDPGFEHNPGQVLEGTFVPQLVDDLNQGFVGTIARRATEEARDAAGATLAAAMPSFAARVPPMPAPRDARAGAVLPDATPDDVAIGAFLGRLGGAADRAVVIRPPGGEALAIGPQKFIDAAGQSKIGKDTRGPFLPLIADAVADPDEVWVALEWRRAEQRPIVRRRRVARFNVAARQEVALAVFEWTGAFWRGVTAFAPRAGKAAEETKHHYLDNRARFGVRVYARRAAEDEGCPAGLLPPGGLVGRTPQQPVRQSGPEGRAYPIRPHPRQNRVVSGAARAGRTAGPAGRPPMGRDLCFPWPHQKSTRKPVERDWRQGAPQKCHPIPQNYFNPPLILQCGAP